MSHWKDFLDTEARGGRYLPWKEVGRATGLSRTTAWRLQKRGDFPAPYSISPGRVGYREDEVEAWRASRDHSPPRARLKPGSSNGAVNLAPPSPAPVSRSEPAGTPGPECHVAQRLTSTPGTLPTTAPSAALRKSGRRRSQHAQAIAQQILFDF